MVILGGMGFHPDDLWILKLNSKGNSIWQVFYGDSDPLYHSHERAYFVQQTKDGRYIIVGEKFINLPPGYQSSTDIWILKLDSNGTWIWEKCYGGKDDDYAYSIQQTKDGGYAIAGYTYSCGAGDRDFWFLKLDSNGILLNQKTYGGSKKDYAECIQQTNDGGYIIAGSTNSFGAGDFDFWVLKIDYYGNIKWQKTYGGPKGDYAHSIQQTKDRGYIVAGSTRSFGKGKSDFWVIKLDANGNIEWERTYGGNKEETAWCIKQTKDGGYIVAGQTRSFGKGGYDIFILKLDSDGDIDPSCRFIESSNAQVSNTSVSSRLATNSSQTGGVFEWAYTSFPFQISNGKTKLLCKA